MSSLSKISGFVFFTFMASISFATVWEVGPTQFFTTPNALYLTDQADEITINDGDTINIDPGDYTGTDALAAWEQNNLLIRGISVRPHMIADGENILGKGIWVCVGNDIIVDNIEFSGATVPDENGAGIRLDGTGLTVRKCYFHDNENGILTSNPGEGNILIEYSEFAFNGFGDGFTHNMYIGNVESFTLQYSYSHHTNIGHNVKSRARNNTIIYNRIMDEETGNSSRLIDISNGGYTTIMGNVMMQGENAENNNAVGYGLEGFTDSGIHRLFFVNNTIVNKRVASCNYLHLGTGTEEAHIINNIFAGTGEMLVGDDATVISNNYKHDDIDHFNFMDEPGYDYQLLSTSPAIDSGMLMEPPSMAEYHYTHPTSGSERITTGVGIDVGAYEFVSPANLIENESDLIKVYPNPSDNGLFYFMNPFTDNEPFKFSVFDMSGKTIQNQTTTNSTVFIDLSCYEKGSYVLVVEGTNQIFRTILVNTL